MTNRNRGMTVVFAVLSALVVGALAVSAGPLDEGRAPSGNGPQKSLGSKADASPLAPLGSGFTYQGRLTTSGSPANGQHDLQFSLFDAARGGAQVGSTLTVLSQTVSSGQFTVQLDFGSAAFSGDARWLQIAVRSAGGPTYAALTPRQPLSAAPYALGLAPGAVISGTISSLPMLSAKNSLAYGLYGFTGGAGSAGVWGEASNSSSGMGVWGHGGYCGVAGTTEVTGGIGVYGESHNGSTAIGVRGLSNNGTRVLGTSSGLYGVEGQNNSDTGPGVAGISYGSSGPGIYGYSGSSKGVWGNSSDGYGVFGSTTNGTGVYGVSDNGLGVYGYGVGIAVQGDTVAGIGVLGTSGHVGVQGDTTSGIGVLGSASSTTSMGVSAQNSGGGRALEARTDGPGNAVFAQSTTGIGVYASSASGQAAVLGSNISGTGVAGEATGATGVGVKASGYVTNTALLIDGGTIKVNSAAAGRPIFVHTATAANTSGNTTTIDNPFSNGDPNAIVIAVPNWNPGGSGGVYNIHPIGVYYTGSRWAIFNQDSGTMPLGAAFNVMVVKQ